MPKLHRGAPDQPAVMIPPVQLKRKTGYRSLLSRSIGRSWLVALLAAVLSMGVIVGTPHSANADQAPVSLGDAASFGVLAGAAVTNTDLTAITGDLGVSPGNSLTGFPPGTVSGTIHAGDAGAANAKADLIAAYNDLSGRTPAVTVPTELGGTTITSGVYNSTNGIFGITGTLTLDAEGEPDAVFIFQATTLSTANVSNINLLNGAQADNVFWQVSGSATLGTYSTFRGNVLALTSMTVSAGTALYGRAFALNNTVILQGTSNPPKTRITVPNDPPTTTTLTTSANPSQNGQPITFTAAVSAVTGSVVPQGEVVFKDGSTIIGSGWHDDSGPATFTTSSLDAGPHPITAVYLGGNTSDGQAIIHFAPSRSPELIQTVQTSLWDNTAIPAVQSYPDPQASTAGVKFKATTAGTINGIRFYKGAQNTGTHTASLWTSSGQLLASATFTNETASGWQQANFPTPVNIAANTTYLASYHSTSGYYSVTRPYFTTQYTNGLLIALANGAEGGNGVYKYNATNTFPTSGYQASNYWVDVMFTPSNSLWDNTAVPAVQSQPDFQPSTAGVKFKATTAGTINGIRFYKGAQNTGTHTASLWTSSGQLLASATFTNETASGWQQANFPTPVNIAANTTYLASYHSTSGYYSVTKSYFTTQYTNGPLTALANGAEGGNGVYTYGATNTFPTSGYQASNYWIDVIFVSS
ncbi:hypothetical protein FHR32_000060 [Streptosporangium album]|uniref:DUF4082 domain-containing protein n=2 Tax=Streptosporangium album TaxID=47479 RepID=A0A7W7RPF4_9ACTN|nr:hypothetical protein [Streptosporangium album]